MDIRLLIDVPSSEDAALARFEAVRQVCRANARRRPSLGAMVLFSGQVTCVLLEGGAADLADAEACLLTVVPGAVASAPPQCATGSSPRLLPAGACHVGYITEEQGGELAQATVQTMEARVRHFLSQFDSSDHD